MPKLDELKFEANVKVFNTPVTLAPMQGNEIGFRALPGEPGIQVQQQNLIDAEILEAKSPIQKFIPQTTEIRTIIYDKALKKFEFAVNADFGSGGALSGEEVDALSEDDLKKEMEKRRLEFKEGDVNGNKDALKAYEPFILNKYPNIFTLDSVALYLVLSSSPAAAGGEDQGNNPPEGN